MSTKTIKIAVVSDLHVYSMLKQNEQKPSYLGVESKQDNHLHPINGLKQFVKSNDLSADYLLCAGDLCNKADSAALRFGWEQLQSLKINLGAKELLATAGNHDIDSRLIESKFDAKEQVQALRPFHPIDDEKRFDKYWSRHYVIKEFEDIRFLLLNSAAYHGYTTEYKHGRVSEQTLVNIEEELKSLPRKNLNILLVHHHPTKHGDITLKDYTSMKGGDSLLKVLTEGNFGEWLIIHGHRHVPSVCYSASSNSDSAVVFAAGSFSAVLYDEIQSIARNQFYIIELNLAPPSDSPNLFLTGRFNAWDWIYQTGWQKASSGSGLPARGGFGARINIRNFTSRIKNYIINSKQPYISINELFKEFVELEYLLPKDVSKLVENLKSVGIACLFDDEEQLYQLGVKNES